MPRQPRLDAPETLHHVMVRGLASRHLQASESAPRAGASRSPTPRPIPLDGSQRSPGHRRAPLAGHRRHPRPVRDHPAPGARRLAGLRGERAPPGPPARAPRRGAGPESRGLGGGCRATTPRIRLGRGLGPAGQRPRPRLGADAGKCHMGGPTGRDPGGPVADRDPTLVSVRGLYRSSYVFHPGGPARPKIPMHRRGADCAVVAGKRGNARGVKGAGHSTEPPGPTGTGRSPTGSAEGGSLRWVDGGDT